MQGVMQEKYKRSQSKTPKSQAFYNVLDVEK